MQHYLFPDNTVFVNFAWVDQLELLRAYLGGRGRLTQAVEYEISQSKVSSRILERSMSRTGSM